jgi:hypothetical protein
MGLHSRFIKPARSRFSLDILLLTVTAAMTVVGTVAVLAPPPDPDRGVAVIFSPWTAAGDALAQSSAAGGRFVRFGAFPFIAVVVPDGPGYVDRVLGRGAWFALDPSALAACLGSRIVTSAIVK